jgi:hypothetical protein
VVSEVILFFLKFAFVFRVFFFCFFCFFSLCEVDVELNHMHFGEMKLLEFLFHMTHIILKILE